MSIEDSIPQGVLKTTVTGEDNILALANRLTSGDRPEAYGTALRDYRCTAALWTAILQKAGVIDRHHEIRPDIAALMMVAVKVSRLAINPTHQDSQADGAGYFRVMQLIQQGLDNEGQDS